MKFAFLSFSVLLGICSFAQQPVPQWINRYNGVGDYSDKFNCVEVDASGNIYLAGYTVRTGNRLDYLVVKMNSSGDTLWSRTFNGTDNKDDEVLAMAIDASGNTYVTGYSRDSQFNDDIITIKYGPDGTVLWANTYNNTSSNQDDQGNSICIDQSGNIIVAGQTDVDPSAVDNDAFVVISYSSGGSTNWTYLYNLGITERAVKVISGTNAIYVAGRTDNGNDDDVTVLKLNSTGTVLWNLPIDFAGFDDRPADMKLDASGNILVCGRTDNGSDDDLLVLKLNSSGALTWKKKFDISAAGNDRASAMVLDASGNSYITGRTDVDPSTVTNYDFCTLKLNSSGIQQWVKTFNGSANLTDEANAICLTSSGNLVVTGRSDGTANPLVSDYGIKTISYNSSGVVQWSQFFQGTGNQNENGNAIAPLAGGAILVVGSQQNAQSQSDALALNYGQSGNLVWQKIYNGLGDNSDNVNAMVVDASGNTYLAGYTYSRTALRDMCVIKLNTVGDTVWVRTFDGSSKGNDEANDIQIDNLGNVYVTGYTKESNTDYDITTLKYSASGALLWVVNFNNATINGEDKGVKLLLDPSSNVYISGYTDRDPSPSMNEDIVLLKYNSSGVLQWNKQFNGAGNGKDIPYDMLYLNSSKIVIAGSTSNGTDQDALILQFSSSGTQLWAQTKDGGSGSDRAVAIASDAFENVVIAGRTFNGTDDDILCIQYSPSGTQNWIYTFDSGTGNDEANAITVDGTGGIYLGCTSDSGTSTDALLVRLNATGSEVWKKLFDGMDQQNDLVTDLFFDSNNYIVLAGQSDLTSGSGSIQSDFLLNKYTTAGDLVWSTVYDSGEQFNDGINVMTHDQSGNIYVSGNSYSSNGQKDIVTIKYDSPLNINELFDDAASQAILYPNPSGETLNILLPGSEQDWTITILDLTGKEFQKQTKYGNKVELDLSSLNSGLYIVSAEHGESKYVCRLTRK